MAVGIGVIVGAGVDVGIGVAVGNGVGKTFAVNVGRAESASLMRSLTNSSFSSLEGAQATDNRTMVKNRHKTPHRTKIIIPYLLKYPFRPFGKAAPR